MMPLSRFKLVTFDVTNTLLKFRMKPGSQYKEVGDLYGVSADDAVISAKFKENYKLMTARYPNFGRKCNICWEDWWREVVKKTFIKYTQDDEKLKLMANYLIEMYKTDDSWKVADGTFELLDFLKESNLKLGVVSNFDPRLSEVLANMKLEKYFDFILTSYDAGYVKPHSGIFEEALSRSEIVEISPRDALHVGDNPECDYIGAKKAGWSAVIVDGRQKKTEILDKYTNVMTTHVFDSLQDLNDNIRSGMVEF